MKIKLKYFIRGLGVGIVFTALIMSISLQNSRSRIRKENTLSKDEIIEKAISYGMVEANQDDTSSNDPSEDVTADTNASDSEADTAKEQDNATNEEENTESDKEETEQTENTDADEMKNDQEDVNATEENSTEESKDADTEASTEESKDTGTETSTQEDKKSDQDKNSSVVTIEYIPIEITSGMTASSVSTMLKEKGIIEDADEFRTYMSEQGYSGKIHTGEYLIPVDATYKKIADIISK